MNTVKPRYEDIEYPSLTEHQHKTLVNHIEYCAGLPDSQEQWKMIRAEILGDIGSIGLFLPPIQKQLYIGYALTVFDERKEHIKGIKI